MARPDNPRQRKVTSSSQTRYAVAWPVFLCALTTDGDGMEMIDGGMTLTDVGVDSLVAIELRNWWKQSLGSDISVLELLNVNLK